DPIQLDAKAAISFFDVFDTCAYSNAGASRVSANPDFIAYANPRHARSCRFLNSPRRGFWHADPLCLPFARVGSRKVLSIQLCHITVHIAPYPLLVDCSQRSAK